MIMIDEKKINEAAIKEAALQLNSIEGEVAMSSFIKGARWTQQEFIKSLWHDYTELPDFKQPIVYILKCAFKSIQSLNNLNKDSFDSVFKDWGEFKWAYSKDILPKKYFKIL